MAGADDGMGGAPCKAIREEEMKMNRKADAYVCELPATPVTQPARVHVHVHAHVHVQRRRSVRIN